MHKTIDTFQTPIFEKEVVQAERRLLKCGECGDVFSERSGTPMRDIKSPISNVASALKIRGEGMGLGSIPKKSEYSFFVAEVLS